MSVVQPSSKRNRLRRWRWPLIAAGLVLAGGAAFVGWRVARVLEQRRQLAETIAALDAADPHWRLNDLEARRAVIPAGENSAKAIRAARAFLPLARGRDNYRRADWFTQVNRLAPNVRLTDEQYREAIDALEEVEPAVGAVLRVAGFPSGRHPIVYAPDGISTLLRHVDDMTRLDTDVLKFLLHVHIHEGDGSAATRDSAVYLHFGRSLGDEPIGISQLVRGVRHVGAAARGVERVLGQGTAPDADLARLQERFAEEAAFDPWPVVVHGERAVHHQMMDALQRGVLKPSRLRSLIGTSGPRTPPTAVQRAREWLDDRFPPDLDLAHDWALRYWTRLIDATEALPWHARVAVVKAFQRDADSAPELAHVSFVSLDRILDGLMRGQAFARTAAAGIAAERFRMKHGAWPESPDDLVPEFLTAVPADPFDGKPVRFRRLGDGVVVYTLGPDAADNGGNLADASPQPEGTDLGFRLWDVPHRRRPPTPAGGPP
jgi:hypothetical protein